jgi:hypothetical protein
MQRNYDSGRETESENAKRIAAENLLSVNLIKNHVAHNLYLTGAASSQ